jgi:diacylglycerol kinase family enzyme
MKPRNVCIIYNPNRASVEALRRAFTGGGATVVLSPTTAEPGSATALAAAAVKAGCDLIVAFGGDGTACQVAEALVGTGIAMAVFPGGTGNLFARSFYAVPTPAQFISMIGSGAPQPVDMIELNFQDTAGNDHKRLFMVGLGLGKVSDAISDASPVFKRLLGKLAYVIRVTLACLTPGARRFTFQSEGANAQEQEAAAVFVLNVAPPTMSMISRGVNASDGLMDIAVFSGANVLQLASSAACLAFGCPERSRHYRRMRTQSVTIHSSEPVRPNIDGDPAAATTAVHMRVLRGAVNIVLSC